MNFTVECRYILLPLVYDLDGRSSSTGDIKTVGTLSTVLKHSYKVYLKNHGVYIYIYINSLEFM